VAAPILFLALRPGERGAGSPVSCAARLLGPTTLTLGAWFAVGARTGLFHEYSEYGTFLVLHPEHGRIITAEVPAALGRIGSGLPYLVPLAGLLIAGRPKREGLVPLVSAACLILFLLFAYLHDAGDPSQWIAWSAARVLMPVPALLALAAAAGGIPPTPEAPSRAASTPR
jgi:hypothetical protein